GSTDDGTYSSIESSIQSLTSDRDALAAKIRSALNAAAFDGTPIDEKSAKQWISQAHGLIEQAASLASS
ncbi:MAG TPA: hypothetical protein VGU02_15520, partial [Gaiellaceae bacterium]|nr:hypothetical protein [Gaiellaceae bacterium]